MNFILFIARRYLFSKKRMQVISIISWISVLGVFIGTAALVILLSAFNGLENWVVRLYNAFDSDVKIEPAQGKWINAIEFPGSELKELEGVEQISGILEENCLVMFGENQYVCTMKGVEAGFSKMTGIDTMMVDGNFTLLKRDVPMAVVGSGVAYSLKMSLDAIDTPLMVYVPKDNIGSTLNPEDAFRKQGIFPSGVFEIQPEFDTKYMIVPLSFAESLSGFEDRFTSVEIKLSENADQAAVIESIRRKAGNKYTVKNRFEQHELLYKIINAEKWAVFLVLCFILLIAVFNVTGSLTMLVVEKSADIRTLQSLGAGKSTIRKIFFAEGMMISLIGMTGGLLAGLLVVFLQGNFSLVLINEIDAYPVLVKLKDLLAIAATVVAIGALAAWLPSSRAVSRRSLNAS
ncbi:MAG: FtsX-like permease family protein [Bacteroidia bacterium]